MHFDLSSSLQQRLHGLFCSSLCTRCLHHHSFHLLHLHLIYSAGIFFFFFTDLKLVSDTLGRQVLHVSDDVTFQLQPAVPDWRLESSLRTISAAFPGPEHVAFQDSCLFFVTQLGVTALRLCAGHVGCTGSTGNRQTKHRLCLRFSTAGP